MSGTWKSHTSTSDNNEDYDNIQIRKSDCESVTNNDEWTDSQQESVVAKDERNGSSNTIGYEIEIDYERCECSICFTMFDNLSELKTHIKDHFKTYQCAICNEKVVGDTKYKFHISSHKNFGNNILKTNGEPAEYIINYKNIKKKIDYNPIKLQIDLDIPCGICGRLFKNDNALERHSLTHTEDKNKFFCAHCNKGFSTKTNLRIHLRVHTGEKPYSCRFCEKKFNTQTQINCHIRSHTGEKPYPCPHCDKRFNYSTDLRRHRRTHGFEEKRFSCSICGWKFYENKFLVKHLFTHQQKARKQSSKSGKQTFSPPVEAAVPENDDEYENYEYILG